MIVGSQGGNPVFACKFGQQLAAVQVDGFFVAVDLSARVFLFLGFFYFFFKNFDVQAYADFLIPDIGAAACQDKIVSAPGFLDEAAQTVHEVFERACGVVALFFFPEGFCQLLYRQFFLAVAQDIDEQLGHHL
ncbi:hypothetical protein SDC9_176932 [bioreactor metagenome]|uniref:Uncharacterized protein n=1 Tax=bioreactor metagenome TaxID=1076179 RepID=A0A645GUP3_9ZZZZ